MALLSLRTPFLWNRSFSQALIYAVLKRLHTITRINTKRLEKGEASTNIPTVFKGALNNILPLNQITPFHCERAANTSDSTEIRHPTTQRCAGFSHFSAPVKTMFTCSCEMLH